jgi:peptidoglycan/LPS O-acetylase OafA/YrhL
MAWLGAERLVVALTRLRVLPAVEFVGRNSIWTYLWHIPLVEIVPPFCAAIRYPLVLLGAMSITAIQAYVVGRVFAPWIHRPAVRRHMVALLTG